MRIHWTLWLEAHWENNSCHVGNCQGIIWRSKSVKMLWATQQQAGSCFIILIVQDPQLHINNSLFKWSWPSRQPPSFPHEYNLFAWFHVVFYFLCMKDSCRCFRTFSWFSLEQHILIFRRSTCRFFLCVCVCSPADERTHHHVHWLYLCECPPIFFI